MSPDSDWAAESTCEEAAPVSLGAALHVGDVGGNLLGALGRLLYVAGDFLRRRALLFHRSRDGRRYLRQPFNGAADFLDRIIDSWVAPWMPGSAG